ncbi:hypothetical protein HZA97_02820 [Candidatus Woesearchaeota archaeon]|nr:hypothetical protein [Candidatus Woesearchaeota archaeon]
MYKVLIVGCALTLEGTIADRVKADLELISPAGYDCTLVNSSLAALSCLKNSEEKFDYIIVDNVMWEMGGVRLFRYLGGVDFDEEYCKEGVSWDLHIPTKIVNEKVFGGREDLVKKMLEKYEKTPKIILDRGEMSDSIKAAIEKGQINHYVNKSKPMKEQLEPLVKTNKQQ